MFRAKVAPINLQRAIDYCRIKNYAQATDYRLYKKLCTGFTIFYRSYKCKRLCVKAFCWIGRGRDRGVFRWRQLCDITSFYSHLPVRHGVERHGLCGTMAKSWRFSSCRDNSNYYRNSYSVKQVNREFIAKWTID